jgi:hypothetical protein
LFTEFQSIRNFKESDEGTEVVLSAINDKETMAFTRSKTELNVTKMNAAD